MATMIVISDFLKNLNQTTSTLSSRQKQSPGCILYETCSKKFRKIYRKTLVPQYRFLNKVASISLQFY